MTYTQLGLVAIVVAVVADMWVFRTRLLTRRAFWVAYAIIVFFQLLTNGVLTGFRIVRYDGSTIIGSTTPDDAPPPFIGDGRLVFAPIEDLMFGFGLVVLTLVLWVWWGRRGLQRTPYAGPPIRGFPGANRLQPGAVSASGAGPAPASEGAAGPEPAPGDPGVPPRR